MPEGITAPGVMLLPSDRAGRARPRSAGFTWATVSLMIFSGCFVITGFNVTHELWIWDIMALRFGVGAALLAPAILRPESRLSIVAWSEGLLFCPSWGLPFVLLVALGIRFASAGEAAVAPAAMPVFAGIASGLVLGERQGKARWLGYGVVVVGLIWLVEVGAADQGAPDPIGLLALLGAGLLWTVYTIVFRGSVLSPMQAAALICTWSAVLFLPAYLLLGLPRLPVASPSDLAFQVIYQGVLMSCVAVAAFNRAVALLGSSAATAIIALLPAVASILAIPVLSEVPRLGLRSHTRAAAGAVGGKWRHRDRRLSRRHAPTHSFHVSKPPRLRRMTRDSLLFPPDPQSGKSRALPGRSWPALRDGTS